MKRNVDLTLDRDFPKDSSKTKGTSFRGMFPYILETYQWIEDGVKREFFNHENPNSRKDFDDFVKGISIVNTGSRGVRRHKLDIRGTESGEICYECGKPIRIPWNGCSCSKKYMIRTHGKMQDSCRKQLNFPTIIK